MKPDTLKLTPMQFASELKNAYNEWLDKEADIEDNEMRLTNLDQIFTGDGEPKTITVESVKVLFSVEMGYYTTGNFHAIPILKIVVEYLCDGELIETCTTTDKEWEDEICEEMAKALENELERRYAPREMEE